MGRPFFALVVAAGCLGGCSLLLAPDEGGYTSGNAGAREDGSADVVEVDAGGSDARVDAADGDAETGAPLPSAYVTEMMKDAPVAYFRLGESSLPSNPLAPQIRDEVSGALVGTRTGTITCSATGALASESNTAMAFGEGYLELGNRFAFSGTAAFTLEMWIKVASPSFSHVITKQDRGDPKSGYAIFTNANAISFERFVTNNKKSIDLSFATSDFFNHFAASYDGATLRAYVNGELAGEVADARTMPLTSAPLLLATDAVGATDLLFHGALDEVAIYDKALSQERLKAHVSASLP